MARNFAFLHHNKILKNIFDPQIQDDSQVSNDVVAFSSEDVDDMYDVPRKPNGVTLRKSNSRVSSNGKLRLRVESFRNNNNNNNNNNNAKSSSGTQTDISVVRNASSHKTEQQQQEQAGYTGQYKKRAAPNKPARLVLYIALDKVTIHVFSVKQVEQYFLGYWMSEW